MLDCNLTNILIRDSVFMQNFDSIQNLKSSSICQRKRRKINALV